MSNDDVTPPSGQPGPGTPDEPDGIPGFPNDPVSGTPSEPTQIFPTVPPPTGTPPVAPFDPVAEEYVDPAAVDPPVDNYDLPWYKNPGQLALALFALIAVIGLIILLFVLASDDDDGAVDDADSPVSVVVTRADALGNPVAASITAVVTPTGPPADQYVWVVPSDAVAGEPAVRQTDASGRTEFRWQAVVDDDEAALVDPSWTVELGEVVPADVAAGGISASCEVDRGPDVAPAPLAVNVTFAGDDADPAAPRIATYSFPNVDIGAGDRVTCTMQNSAVPVDTTTTTTIPLDTTTVPEETTTVPEETTTTAAPPPTPAPTPPPTAPPATPPPPTSPPPTEPPPTAPPPTTPPPTEPPPTTVPPPEATPGSALEFLTGRSDLSSFVRLIQQAGIEDEFDDPDRVMTVFAPSNDAIDAYAADPDSLDITNAGDLRDLIRAHVVDGEALLRDDIAALSEVDVQFGDPQPVDPGPPVLVGGAEITDIDQITTASIVQVVDQVIDPIT